MRTEIEHFSLCLSACLNSKYFNKTLIQHVVN